MKTVRETERWRSHLWIQILHAPPAGLGCLGLHLDLGTPPGLLVPQSRCPPSHLKHIINHLNNQLETKTDVFVSHQMVLL